MANPFGRSAQWPARGTVCRSAGVRRLKSFEAVRDGTALRSVAELAGLRGRVALITGAAGHVGSSTADTLAELGASIAVLDREEAACRRTAAQLQRDRGVDAHPFVVDLRETAAVREVPRATVARFGRLDILIHCAALGGAADTSGWAVPFDEQTVDAWSDALRVNLTAAFTLTQAARSALAASRRGVIILVASIYGLVGPDMRLYEATAMANPAGYAASKGGLLQLVRYLATVFAPDIRVNAISPGGIWRGQPEAFVRRYHDRTPLRRMATEEDLKGAMAFLSSDLSSYVTGHNLVVDGGWTAW